MSEKRVPLYERLPEIYRIRDMEQDPPGQLMSYLSLVENVFGDIHENIESLYDDLFIESCDDWVIPYIGDMLGTTHLKGDPWTLRADVADTIALRRTKGTLASIERLTYDLTQWGVHCVELRERLVWSQHLNHLRPDSGDQATLGLLPTSRFSPAQGGMMTLRDPALLSLLDSPFDPFSHLPDLKPPAFGNLRFNLPNLGIFLWRLEDYRVKRAKPIWRGKKSLGSSYVVRFEVHPTGISTMLFNTYQFDPDRDPPVITSLDGTPGPIHPARLTEGSPSGCPEHYLSIDTYDPTSSDYSVADISDVGLILHLPEPQFTGEGWEGGETKAWKIKGANLCAWEHGIQPMIRNREIVIDPRIGRVLIGVETEAEAQALVDHLLITYTYGAVGPVGAHPVTRSPVPAEIGGDSVITRVVNQYDSGDPDGLTNALNDLDTTTSPVVVEIRDSMTHILELSSIQGVQNEDGGPNLRLNRSLIIRSADDERPVILLKKPLRFRTVDVAEARNVSVQLEGLHITRFMSEKASDSFPEQEPLIARAAVDSLEVVGCTLDPGGHLLLNGSKAPVLPSIRLREPYGFGSEEEEGFDQTPDVVLQRTISGPLLIDTGYTLSITDSIIDAGMGEGDENPGGEEDESPGGEGIENPGGEGDESPGGSVKGIAVGGATDPINGWGPQSQVFGVTFLGRMRVESIIGRGGIWTHSLNVLDNQKGCIRYSYFSGVGDRLPQNIGCVKGTEAELTFVSLDHNSPSYVQIKHTSDSRIKEQGPGSNTMGAFGFLMEAHKWRNLQIRFREFMPVGIRPLFIPVT